MEFIRTLSTLALASACLAAPASAQIAALSGRVTDPQGALVAGASVRATREDGSTVRRATTDTRGIYRVDALHAGLFAVEVDKPGFRRSVSLVTVEAGVSATLDVALTVAGIDDAIVVTASGRPQAAHEASKALSVIDAQEIHARNAATLVDVVRLTPGVQIRDNGGPGQLAQMRIRGLRPDAAAVLVDGLRFRDAATLQGDATSFLSSLHFIAADRVEVLRGSGSSLYGTNAVGGVVNIVSREGGGPFRAEAQAEAGSLGYFRTRGALGGAALDNRLSFSAGGMQWNLLDGLDGDDAAQSTGAQGRLRYQFGQAASVTARILAARDRTRLNVSPTASGIPAANLPDAIVVDARPVSRSAIEQAEAGGPLLVGDATFIPGRNDPDSRKATHFHTTALQFQAVQSAAVSWQASYQRVGTDRTFRNGPLGSAFQPEGDSRSDYAGDIDTLDARGTFNLAPWATLSAGYEFERERFEDLQDSGASSAGRVRTETEIVQRAHAGFASAQLSVLDRRLQVSLSGRLQRFSLEPARFDALGVENVYARIPLSAPPRALTGDVSAAYLPGGKGTKLRAHAGTAYRAPSLYERFGGGFFSDPVTGLVVFSPYGDPRLAPDRYKSFDGGVDQLIWRDRILVTATVFVIDVDSLSAFDFTGGIRPDTDPYGRSGGYLNGSGGFSRGLELSVDARPSPTLRASASYSYTRARTTDDITVPGFFRVPSVFGHTASLVATKQWSDRLDTSLDVFHGSPSYGAFFAAGRTRAYRFDGYTKAAVTASYRVAAALRGYVRVDNLLGATYYQSGWRNPGRTVVAGVSVGQ